MALSNPTPVPDTRCINQSHFGILGPLPYELSVSAFPTFLSSPVHSEEKSYTTNETGDLLDPIGPIDSIPILVFLNLSLFYHGLMELRLDLESGN
jgi:hypothetical protein